MAVSLEQFVQQLTASGLMTKVELDAFRAALSAPRQPKNGEDLARELIRAGKLTKYQATAVVQGKIKGLRFGEYVVLDKLGAGGMGVVLKAQHRRMERTVAVKILPAAAMKQPGAVDRFYREVKAAAKLTHPNIVAAHDAGEHEGMHFLVMEYVEGRDLSAIVHEGGPMPVKKAVDCVLQAARGLAYSHEHGVVHRDIKPANLLLAKDGTLKILDMGLARLRDDGIGGAEATAGRELTQSGQIMGTVDYMSPEQADDTRKADARADIYSLGCTLYRIVAGVCPFEGETMMQKLMAHREKPIPSLVAAVEKYSPGVNPSALLEGVNAVFQRMLAKLPEERQQSMGEVVAELEAAIAPPKAAPPKRAGGASTPDRSPPASVDGGEFAFLSSPSAVKAVLQAAPAVTREETVNRQKPESETGDNIPPPPAREKQTLTGKKKHAANQKVLLLGLAGGAVALTLLGVLVAIFNSRPNSSAKPDTEKPAVAGVKPDAKKPVAVKSDLPLVNFPQQLEVPVSPPRAADEWSDPVNLGTVVNSKSDESGASVSADGLTLLFCSNRSGTYDLFASHRAAEGEQWGPPLNLGDKVNSDADDTDPALSADGLTLYFASNRAGGQGKADIWICRRDDANAPWGQPTPLPGEINTVKDEKHPCISADGLTLLFNSDRGDSMGGIDIWQATRATLQDSFGAPVNLKAPVNSSASDAESSLSVDGLRLFFLSNRPGGVGSFDLWLSERRSTKNSFGPAINLGRKVNSSAADGAPTLLTNGNTLYFNSDRPGGQGGHDLWMCTRKVPAASGDATAPYVWPKDAPPPAVAPFNETKALEHQTAWARNLRVKVEFENSIGMKFRLIPPGEFMMGSTAEEIEAALKIAVNYKVWSDRIKSEAPRQKVTLTQPFALGVHEITQAQYLKVMGQNPAHFSATGDGKTAVQGQNTTAFPVEQVTWNDAIAFCAKLSELAFEKSAGRVYRLPTEAEWEYACRAGTTMKYSNGDSDEKMSLAGWTSSNAGSRTHAVGELLANPFGLYDMHGNVWEWCADWSGPYSTSAVDPVGAVSGGNRVRRGGSWEDVPMGCRSADRRGLTPDNRNDSTGFRVVLSIDAAKAKTPTDAK